MTGDWADEMEYCLLPKPLLDDVECPVSVVPMGELDDRHKKNSILHPVDDALDANPNRVCRTLHPSHIRLRLGS